MSEKWSELRISNDFLFGKVMRNQTVCKKLIELILDIQIDHIEYPENQKVIDLTATLGIYNRSRAISSRRFRACGGNARVFRGRERPD